MPTTSNFGWTTPADTDLVKDGAAAIRTLGNGIDTSFLDLKGGTTDQVLAKNSNTDLDFKWVAQDDSNAIQNALLTTTGDTIYASAASTPARLGVGSTGQVLTVAGGVPTWAAPVTAGMTLLSTTTLSGASTTISTIDQTYVNLQIFITGMTNATAAATPKIEFNGSATLYTGVQTYNSNTTPGTAATTSSTFNFVTAPTRTDANNFWGITIFNYASTSAYKGVFSVMGATRNAGGEGSGIDSGYLKTNSGISSLVISNAGGDWTAGTVRIYGVK